jgi:hypothetical protein
METTTRETLGSFLTPNCDFFNYIEVRLAVERRFKSHDVTYIARRLRKSESFLLKITAFRDIVPCSLLSEAFTTYNIALMMEAVSVSETSIYFYETTRRNIAEHCQIHTRTYDYMKYHVN